MHKCLYMYIELKLPHIVTSGATNYLTKASVSARQGESSFVLLAGESSGDLQTPQAVVLALGCLYKTLLPKTPHTSDTRFEEVKLALTWKPPPQGLTLLVSGGAMQAPKGMGGRYQLSDPVVSLRTPTMTRPARQPQKYIGGTAVSEVTNSCLIEHQPAQLEGSRTWH